MIRYERTRGGLIITVEGQLNSSTAEGFRAAAIEQIEAEDRAVVIDLAAITFVSSAGLRALLMIAKSQGIEVRLCCLSSEVRAVFTMSGFDRILSIFATQEEALTGWGRDPE